jgi:CheY-like chemotaxis protein
MISAVDELDSVVRCIELGADDYLPKPFNPVLLRARIGACLEKKRLRDQEQAYLMRIQTEQKRANDLLNVVIPIGVALSVEQDFHHLLERIVLEAKRLCNADGATLYLPDDHDTLKITILHTDSLHIAMGGTTGVAIPYPPLHLYDPITGKPNHHNVVTHAFLINRSINVPDAYQTDDFDFSGTKEFDHRIGYHSTSFLTILLKNQFGQVIGVLQLINAQDPGTGAVIAFDQGLLEMMEALSSLAAVALEAYLREQSLRQQVQQLRIEIDQVKRQQQVDAIVSTDFFQNLQSKASAMRNRTHPTTEERPTEPASPPPDQGHSDAVAVGETAPTID